MTSEQMILVGLIASVITYVLRLVSIYFKYVPSRAVVNIALYVIAGTLAVTWMDVQLPPLPQFPLEDPVTLVVGLLQYVADLLAVAAPVVGFATLIYNLLYEKVVLPLTAKLREKLAF